jgi:hypothetical protein
MLKTGWSQTMDRGRTRQYAVFPIRFAIVKGPKYLASNFLDGRFVVTFLDRSRTCSPTLKCLSILFALYYFSLASWANSKLLRAVSQCSPY